MAEKTLYEELEVERTASKDEIKRAYRKKAAKLHPDVNKEPDAEEKFKRVCEAYMILYDDTSRWKYDQTGQEEKPSDRKPINYEEHVKTVLYRVVFTVVDKLGSQLNNKNIQKIASQTVLSMQKEVENKLKNNKALLKATKEKIDAILKKQVNVERDGLLYKILEAKLKHVETQELLPLREARKSLLIDKKTVRLVLKKIDTDCKDITVEVIDNNPYAQWDDMMSSTWVDPRTSTTAGNWGVGGPF